MWNICWGMRWTCNCMTQLCQWWVWSPKQCWSVGIGLWQVVHSRELMAMLLQSAWHQFYHGWLWLHTNWRWFHHERWDNVITCTFARVRAGLYNPLKSSALWKYESILTRRAMWVLVLNGHETKSRYYNLPVLNTNPLQMVISDVWLSERMFCS